MNAKGSYLRFVGVFLFGPLALTGCATFKAHPDFSMRHAEMRHIAIMPSDVEAYEITFNAGNKPLAELQELVKAKSGAGIEEILKGKGYEVTGIPITSDRLEADQLLKEAWFDIQTLYTQALKDIKANKKKNFTYEIGAGPNYFAEKHQANVILLTRQTGTKLSEGMKAAQMTQAVTAAVTVALTGVGIGGGALPWHSLETEIAFVDAESGDILWYNLEKITLDYTKVEDKNKVILNHIKRILNPFPDSKFKKASAEKTKSDSAAAKSPKEDKAVTLPVGKAATNVVPAPRPAAP